MAKYQNNFKYHEDTTEKRLLTKKDLEFLSNLQKGMNTQDHNSQADPRFWVIRQTEKLYRVEEPDGYELICDTESVAEGFDEMVKYIEDTVFPLINENCKNEERYWMERPTKENKYPTINRDILDDPEEEKYVESVRTLFDEDDIQAFLKECVAIIGEYEVVSYKNMEVNVPDTMFLTHRESEAHLKRNEHNYKKDAHSYSMTAYRSPEVEQLYNIIQKVNWEEVSKRL